MDNIGLLLGFLGSVMPHPIESRTRSRYFESMITCAHFTGEVGILDEAGRSGQYQIERVGIMDVLDTEKTSLQRIPERKASLLNF